MHGYLFALAVDLVVGYKLQLDHRLLEFIRRMATSEGKVSYSSLSKLDNGNANMYYDDEFGDSVWAMPEGSRSTKPDYSYQYPLQSEDFVDGECDSIDEPCNSLQPYNLPPEVNLKNVLSGIFSILTGRNKGIGDAGSQQSPTSNVSFLRSGKNGDSFLHPSVYIPSAPPLLAPLLEPNGINYSAYKEVLDAEPPEWVPDSATTVCMQCTAPFTALTRGRHHCRFCGGIFCRVCTKGRFLLPVKFRERNPQRVCDACYDRLDPLQNILINSISNAAQVAKHDVMDWTCTRGWLNLPVGLSMEHEIYKASNTLRSYYQVWFLLFR